MQYLIIFMTFFILLGCSGNSSPKTKGPLELRIDRMKKLCNHGAGIGTSCHEVAKLYEKPPSYMKADLYESTKYFQYAMHAYRKQCDANSDNADCLSLVSLYSEGRTGYFLDQKQALTYYKKACPDHTRGTECRNLSSTFPVYIKEKQRQKQKSKKINPCGIGMRDVAAAKAYCRLEAEVRNINMRQCYYQRLQYIKRKSGCKQ